MKNVKEKTCSDCRWSKCCADTRICSLEESPRYGFISGDESPCYEFVQKTDGERLREAWEVLKGELLDTHIYPFYEWLTQLISELKK